MKAMVLAAGRGERLDPLTRSVPKCVVPVLGIPLTRVLLERLAGLGVTDAVVNLHHQAQRVRSELGGGSVAGLPRISYSEEEVLLGTGGGLARAAPRLRGQGTVLVHNSDSLSDLDVNALVEAHRASGRPVTWAVTRARTGFSTLTLDSTGRVAAIGPPAADTPPEDGFLFTGCHVVEESVLDRIPGDGPCDIMRALYAGMIADGNVGAFVHEGFWWEFGDPGLYLEGSLRLLGLPQAERERIGRFDPVRRLDFGVVAVGEGADFHTGVLIDGRVALGTACRISEGSVLEDTVVMPGAWVGPGCRLRRTVVGSGVELPAGLVLEGVLVSKDPSPADEVSDPVRRRQGLLMRDL